MADEGFIGNAVEAAEDLGGAVAFGFGAAAAELGAGADHVMAGVDAVIGDMDGAAEWNEDAEQRSNQAGQMAEHAVHDLVGGNNPDNVYDNGADFSTSVEEF